MAMKRSTSSALHHLPHMIVQTGAEPHFAGQFTDGVALITEFLERGGRGCLRLARRREHHQMGSAEVLQEGHRPACAVQRFLPAVGIIHRAIERDGDDIQVAL